MKILFIMSSLGGSGAEKVLVTMLKNVDYYRFDVSSAHTTYEGIYLNENPPQVKEIPIYERPGILLERLGFQLYSSLRISCQEK